jgi:hypothetical protein
VRVPRFRIASVMIFVAIAALDFGAIRALLDSQTDDLFLLVLGALPTVNVLAVGMLIGRRRPGNRRFLLGEAFGAMAFALYVALASFLRDEVVMPYLGPLLDLFDYLEKTIGSDRPFVFIPFLCPAGAVMLGLPQVVFALIGGLLSRKFVITIRITKRPDRTPG